MPPTLPHRVVAPVSSLKSRGLVWSVTRGVSSRDLHQLLRQCESTSASRWQEAIRLMIGAFHLRMVPPKDSYRLLMDVVGRHADAATIIKVAAFFATTRASESSLLRSGMTAAATNDMRPEGSCRPCASASSTLVTTSECDAATRYSRRLLTLLQYKRGGASAKGLTVRLDLQTYEAIASRCFPLNGAAPFYPNRTEAQMVQREVLEELPYHLATDRIMPSNAVLTRLLAGCAQARHWELALRLVRLTAEAPEESQDHAVQLTATMVSSCVLSLGAANWEPALRCLSAHAPADVVCTHEAAMGVAVMHARIGKWEVALREADYLMVRQSDEPASGELLVDALFPRLSWQAALRLVERWGVKDAKTRDVVGAAAIWRLPETLCCPSRQATLAGAACVMLHLMAAGPASAAAGARRAAALILKQSECIEGVSRFDLASSVWAACHPTVQWIADTTDRTEDVDALCRLQSAHAALAAIAAPQSSRSAFFQRHEIHLSCVPAALRAESAATWGYWEDALKFGVVEDRGILAHQLCLAAGVNGDAVEPRWEAAVALGVANETVESTLADRGLWSAALTYAANVGKLQGAAIEDGILRLVAVPLCLRHRRHSAVAAIYLQIGARTDMEKAILEHAISEGEGEAISAQCRAARGIWGGMGSAWSIFERHMTRAQRSAVDRAPSARLPTAVLEALGRSLFTQNESQCFDALQKLMQYATSRYTPEERCTLWPLPLKVWHMASTVAREHSAMISGILRSASAIATLEWKNAKASFDDALWLLHRVVLPVASICGFSEEAIFDAASLQGFGVKGILIASSVPLAAAVFHAVEHRPMSPTDADSARGVLSCMLLTIARRFPCGEETDVLWSVMTQSCGGLAVLVTVVQAWRSLVRRGYHSGHVDDHVLALISGLKWCCGRSCEAILRSLAERAAGDTETMLLKEVDAFAVDMLNSFVVPRTPWASCVLLHCIEDVLEAQFHATRVMPSQVLLCALAASFTSISAEDQRDDDVVRSLRQRFSSVAVRCGAAGAACVTDTSDKQTMLATVTSGPSPLSSGALLQPQKGAALRHVLMGCLTATQSVEHFLRQAEAAEQQATNSFRLTMEDLTIAVSRVFDYATTSSDTSVSQRALADACRLLVAMRRRFPQCAAPHDAVRDTLLLCQLADRTTTCEALAVLKGTPVFQGVEEALQLHLEEIRVDAEVAAQGQLSNVVMTERLFLPPAASPVPAAAPQSGELSNSDVVWTPQRLARLSKHMFSEPSLFASWNRDVLRAFALKVVQADSVIGSFATASDVAEACKRHRKRLERLSKSLGEANQPLGSPKPFWMASAVAVGSGQLPLDDVLSFVAEFSLLVHYGHADAIQEMATLRLGPSAMQDWPPHALKSLMNQNRKYVVKWMHRDRMSQLSRASSVHRTVRGEATNEAACGRRCVVPWLPKTQSDWDKLVPSFYSRLGHFLSPVPGTKQGLDWRDEAFVTMAQSVFHGGLSAAHVATMCRDPQLRGRCVQIERRRWPEATEAELVEAVIRLQGGLPQSLPSCPSLPFHDILRYWEVYHPVLSPGASFFATEMRFVAEHFFQSLDDAEMQRRDGVDGGESQWWLLLREICDTCFPLLRSRRADASFCHHTPESLDLLWQRSRTTLLDLHLSSSIPRSRITLGPSNFDAVDDTSAPHPATSSPNGSPVRWRTALLLLKSCEGAIDDDMEPSLVHLRLFSEAALADGLTPAQVRSLLMTHAGQVVSEGQWSLIMRHAPGTV